MPPRRETAAQSAARFLRGRRKKARRDTEVAAHHGWKPWQPRPKPWLDVPEPWRPVERRFPGAFAAWCEWPNAPAQDFHIWTTGGPPEAEGRGRGGGGHHEERAFVLLDGRWVQRPARPLG